MLPRGGAYEGWDQVAEARQLYEAELMALRLREAGIEVQVLDQSFRMEPVPFVRSLAVVRVLVPSGKAELAREVLARSQSLAAEWSDGPEPIAQDGAIAEVSDEPGGAEAERFLDRSRRIHSGASDSRTSSAQPEHPEEDER